MQSEHPLDQRGSGRTDLHGDGRQEAQPTAGDRKPCWRLLMAVSPYPIRGSERIAAPAAAAAEELTAAKDARSRRCPLCGGPIRSGQHIKRVYGTTLHALCPRTRSDDGAML